MKENARAALIEDFENKFLGYGSWDAPVWFLGIEAGVATPPSMEDEGEDQRRQRDALAREREARADAWKQLGGTPLLDLQEFSRRVAEALSGFDPKCPTAKRYSRLFCPAEGENVALQPTYRILMMILTELQAANRMEEDADTARKRLQEYQRDKLGRLEGDDLIIDLRPGHANRERPHDPAWDVPLQQRAALIATKLRPSDRKVVVAYGKKTHTLLKDLFARPWKLAQWTSHEGLNFESTWYGSNLLACIPHPTGQVKGRTNRYWQDLGTSLADIKRAGP